MPSTFTLDGSAISPATDDTFQPRRFSERFGSIPTMTVVRRGGALPGLPDPWLGKELTWTYGGVTHFVGDCVSVAPRFSRSLGWVLAYQFLGLRNRLDAFPHTDSNTGIDTSGFCLTLEDPNYNPARAGRTVGQILEAVLTMVANAQALDAAAVGNYTGLPSAPALPSVTTDDLDLMTIVPHRPVYFSGEKFGAAIDGFLSQWAPNHRYWIDRDGNHRFMDLREFTVHTFTMGTDDVEPTELSRDVGDCSQRVLVRGQPIAIMAILKLSEGDLTEEFTWGSHVTNAAAKAAWNPGQFRQPGDAQVVGTCVCDSTILITVDPTDAAVAWSTDYWDQSHQQGVINCSSTVVTDFTQYWSSRIVTSPALTAGGTAQLTIDNPMPHTDFDKFTISGLATGGAVVWTQYQVANSDLWPRVTKQSTYPQPFIAPGGAAVGFTSTKMGVVLWSDDGDPPYNTFPLDFDFNPATGMCRFKAPTFQVAGGAAPADVWVALPIQTNPLAAIVPADVAGVPQYEGTSHTVDGLARSLTITADFWRDPGQLAQLLAYAQDVLDSVKDAAVEGSIVHYGMFEAALTFGLAAAVAGDDGDGAYVTGWEDLELPVIGVDLEWPEGTDDALDLRMTLHVSNRRAHYSAEVFLSPEQGYLELGGDADPFDLSDASQNQVGEASSWQGLDSGNALSTPGPDLSDVPTNPGDYLGSIGAPTTPAEYFPDMGQGGAGTGGPAAPGPAATEEDDDDGDR